MGSRAEPFWTSIKIGTFLTALDIGAAQLASALGKPAVASRLYWPNAFIQTLLPCIPVDEGGMRICEGTPWNVIGFWVSIPISVAVYVVAALLVMRAKSRRRQ